VGDSPHDLAAGRAAGVRTAAALWGPFSRAVLDLERPDVWLETPSEIAQLGR
jgi:pyrophosphatase PpaX